MQVEGETRSICPLCRFYIRKIRQRVCSQARRRNPALAIPNRPTVLRLRKGFPYTLILFQVLHKSLTYQRMKQEETEHRRQSARRPRAATFHLQGNI